MLGIFANTPVARSENMRAIRSRGNRSTEMRLRAAILRRGIRGWCLHAKDVRGVPDFLWRREKIAVFVDGCFWHGCPRCGHIPKTNGGYWLKKIERNKERDRTTGTALVADGFKVVRIWECEIRSSISACVDRILEQVPARLRTHQFK
jgi:DNA mismatch endonuclease (patch repair protein)